MLSNFKSVATIFLIATLIFISAAPPARAIPVGVIATLQYIFDIGSWVANILDQVANVANEGLHVLDRVKDTALDPLAWSVAKNMIHSESNTILSQIRGGGNARGETGGPLFVTDWEKVSRNAVSNQRKFFLQELAVTKKVDPAFQGTLLDAFSGNPDKSVFNRLQPTFGQDTGCTGSSCLEDFLGDFSKGDWAGWNSVVTNPGNNPYRSYLELQAEKERREESAKEARINEALASQGALGTQDCVDEPTEEGDSSGGEDTPTIKKCEVTRPGSTVSTDLSKVLGGPSDTLQQADEFSELFVAAFTSLIGSLRSQGIKSNRAIGNDTIIPKSEASVRAANTAQSKKTIEDLKRSVDKTINELASIWEIKAKTLDLIDEIPPGLIYEINQTQKNVDSGGACADKPSVYGQLPIDLENATNQRNVLMEEVGFPINLSAPNLQDENGVLPLGFYENGGRYSERLFTQQAELEYLDQVIIHNGDLEPTVRVSNEISSQFGWGDLSLRSSDRLQSALQLIGAEVAKVAELLILIGNTTGAKAEQQAVNQKMVTQRQAIYTCSLQ